MEEFILNLLESIGEMDFRFVWQIFFYALGVFWLVVLYWVWLDSGDRVSNKIVRCLYVLLVAGLNIIGLIIYLIIRPGQTIEEIYWADLERRYLKYETAELGDCPKCGRQLFPGYTFCPSCKYRLKKKCRRCQVFVDKKDKFCPHCGHEMKKRISPEETSPSKEIMQEQIRATKDEATEVVESKKTRYSRKGGLTVRVGESIVGGYKIIFRKLKSLFTKLRKKKVLKEEKNEDDSVKPKVEKKEKQIKSKKSKKKKKKKKHKSHK
jgi:hypothetical protein